MTTTLSGRCTGCYSRMRGPRGRRRGNGRRPDPPRKPGCAPPPAAAVPFVVRLQDSLATDLRRLERHPDIGDADAMISQPFFATLLGGGSRDAIHLRRYAGCGMQHGG